MRGSDPLDLSDDQSIVLLPSAAHAHARAGGQIRRSGQKSKGDTSAIPGDEEIQRAAALIGILNEHLQGPFEHGFASGLRDGRHARAGRSWDGEPTADYEQRDNEELHKVTTHGNYARIERTRCRSSILDQLSAWTPGGYATLWVPMCSIHPVDAQGREAAL
jgi:hypothetical protein